MQTDTPQVPQTIDDRHVPVLGFPAASPAASMAPSATIIGPADMANDGPLSLLAVPKRLQAIREALPLFIVVLDKCMATRRTRCDLTLVVEADKLGVSNSTLTGWRSRLESLAVVRTERHKSHVTFELLPPFSSCINHPPMPTGLGGSPGSSDPMMLATMLNYVVMRMDLLENHVLTALAVSAPRERMVAA